MKMYTIWLEDAQATFLFQIASEVRDLETRLSMLRAQRDEQWAAMQRHGRELNIGDSLGEGMPPNLFFWTYVITFYLLKLLYLRTLF
jgi:hypothetical protein